MKTLLLFSTCAALAAWVVGCAAALAQSGPAVKSVHWRFEKGADGQEVMTALSEDGRCEAVAGGEATLLSKEVPLAVLPLTGDPNHLALSLRGGHLRAKSCEALNLTKNFTVELWTKFEAARSSGAILLSKGDPQEGNWHFIHQNDGTVQANIFGQTPAYLFSPESGGPVPGAWYHLAAVFEEQSPGKTRIRTFVNGHPRGAALVASMTQTSHTDLFFGSFVKGDLPFIGMIDEVRITPAVLEPKSFLLAGTQAIAEMGAPREPVFVAPGTAIDAALRAKADGAPIVLTPQGYPYFYADHGGPAGRLNLGLPPAGYDTAFATAMQAFNMSFAATGSGYHFAVTPGDHFVVAVGYWDPVNKPGHQVQKVVVDGLVVDTVDPAGDGRGKPFVRLYPTSDRTGDGLLEVFVRNQKDEVKSVSGQMNLIWIFRAADAPRVDADKLARGANPVVPIYFVACGREAKFRGHVAYPALSDEARKKMLPMRPVGFDRVRGRPQPADPIDLEIRGELADRIRTYLDRWGYAPRDDGDRHPLGFSSDCGYEVAGRSLETIYQLGRLMRRDFELKVPLDALLKKQDSGSKFPGAFVGGEPCRTGFIWGQATIFSGLMAYHELTGDDVALAAAKRLADWYGAYLKIEDLAAANYFLKPTNQFSREGATVGQLGEGALEPMLWLYWRTKESKYLDDARRIADLKRRDGGMAWMIHGDIADRHPEFESWHLHANLSTVRGLPWLYAATGDRRHLDDAIAACDRVYERATWGVGCVLEQIPWLRDPDPHDETCQTADELMLSYLLGEFTGEGRFYDRGETIYYNAIRYMQMHRGNFSAFNRLPGPTRGGDAWFCCGWWGAKSLYEAARHLYAASPDVVHVTGYMPSRVDLRLASGVVRLETEADIPRSGRVRIAVTPKGVERFALNLRVPGWAVFQRVRVNGIALDARPAKGYVRLTRNWKAGDRVDVDFELPLRVVLDSAWDTLGTAKVSVDGATPVEARCVSIYRGPAILAQFRLVNGVDLNWAYTGDHPDLFDTLNSVADRFAVGEQLFQSNTGPALTRITHTAKGVTLEWGWKPGPGWGWSVRRSALVRPNLPLSIDYTAEVTLPNLPPPQIEAVAKASRLCGVRMKTSGFIDYTPAKLLVAGKPMESGSAPEGPLSQRDVVLDNGYIQFRIASAANDLALPTDPAGGYQGIYCIPKITGDRQLTAACTLVVTGQSSFAMPIVGAASTQPQKP